MENRPDPDELLKNIQGEEGGRGHLKIFLGYAAGVGKTYAMLEAAHQRKAQGVDVVVGYIETHGRHETEEMLADLEILPRRQVRYKNVNLTELDVDAVLRRNPSLVLVDEFAHTNAPGSRHPRRYLDVNEILDAGIHVYTTLNIQHLESLNDIVAQITGVVVHETVPDVAIDEAAEIEVIDLPPDELLSRLNEGKVYIPDQAARAIQKFFRKGNLTALREISLRRAAERVDDQMRTYMQTRAIPGPWPAGERLVVCISANPMAEKLIRNTRRLADELNAEWYAVYVDVASRLDSHPVSRERISSALQLAEELGAISKTLAGQSIHEAVLEFARKNNITKIVIGKPLRPRWQEWFTGTLVDKLVHSSGDVDVYVISAQPEVKKVSFPEAWQPHHPLSRYFISLVLVTAATLIGISVRGFLEPANLVMLYLLVVLISAIYLGRGPALLSSVTSVLAFDYFLIQPYLTFAVSDQEYIITFIGLFIVSLAVSSLAVRVREQADSAVQRETQSSALYDLGRDLTSAANLKTIAQAIISHISRVFGREAVILVPNNDGLETLLSSPGYLLGPNEMAVATWSYEHGQPAGRGTDTLPAASLRCLPLKTSQGIVGVLGVRPGEQPGLMTPQQRQTLAAFTNQAAIAIERASLVEKARQTELLQAAEKLQTALLNSISHDLRTPLVAITGALTSLDEQADTLKEEYRTSLITTAREEAERLNRLVGNLLSMTRLESGAIKLDLQPGDIQDAIGTALEQLGPRISRHDVKVNVPADFPLVPMDFTLIVQVLVNVLENAAKYSPENSRIEVLVQTVDNEASIMISDRGMGIPSDDLERVFDKFYRVQRPESITGTGLGLTISKGIVEIHKGHISAMPRPGGGSIITIHLPLDQSVPAHE